MVYVIEKNAVEFMHLWSEDAGVSNKSVQHWRRPLDDVVKINSDGSYMAGTGEGGWGYVIRDGEGGVLYAGAGNLVRLTEALQAEVQACWEGAKAAAEHGIERVILETDSLQLVQAMKDNSYRLSSGRILFLVLWPLCLETVTKLLMFLLLWDVCTLRKSTLHETVVLVVLRICGQRSR